MIRAGVAGDLEAVAAIQAEAPEASQWSVADYLEYSFVVAEQGGAVAGFAVWRGVGEGEWELLNTAVARAFRRRGVGGALLGALPAGRVFLEVRESNAAARRLYEANGFRVVGKRRGYYRHPAEDGIVMEREK